MAAVLRLQKGPSVNFLVARGISETQPRTSEDSHVILTNNLDAYLKERFNIPDRSIDSDDEFDNEYAWEYEALEYDYSDDDLAL